MTQQELKDLITDYLGPIIDAAKRETDPRVFNLAEYIAHREALQSSEITQEEFDDRVDRMLRGWNTRQRLLFRIELAKHDGKLPPGDGVHHSNGHRNDSDWESFVDS